MRLFLLLPPLLLLLPSCQSSARKPQTKIDGSTPVVNAPSQTTAVSLPLEQLPELENRDPKLNSELLNWDVLTPVYFAAGASSFPQTEAPSITAAAAWLRRTLSHVVLAGHTGQIGSSEYNRSLGELRAGKVKQALVKNGVPSASIVTVSYGPDRPAANNRNDRVEFGVPGEDVASR